MYLHFKFMSKFHLNHINNLSIVLEGSFTFHLSPYDLASRKSILNKLFIHVNPFFEGS